MENQIVYLMVKELQGVKYVYDSTLNDCYQSVCKKYGMETNPESKQETIDQVKKALSVLFA